MKSTKTSWGFAQALAPMDAVESIKHSDPMHVHGSDSSTAYPGRLGGAKNWPEGWSPDRCARESVGVHRSCRQRCDEVGTHAGVVADAFFNKAGGVFESILGIRESIAAHPGPDPRQAFWKCPADEFPSIQLKRTRCASQRGRKRARLC